MVVVLARPPGRWTALEPRTPTTATAPHTEALDLVHALQPGTQEPAHRTEAAGRRPNSADSTPSLLDLEHPLGVVVVVELA